MSFFDYLFIYFLLLKIKTKTKLLNEFQSQVFLSFQEYKLIFKVRNIYKFSVYLNTLI